MDDATINPVGAYDPIAPIPGDGGRGRRDTPERQPAPRRPAPAPPGAQPAPPSPQPNPAPDADTPRGRHIDDRA